MNLAHESRGQAPKHVRVIFTATKNGSLSPPLPSFYFLHKYLGNYTPTKGMLCTAALLTNYLFLAWKPGGD